MLEVVQHQQHAPVPDQPGDAFDRLFPGHALDPEGAGDSRSDQLGIPDRDQTGERHPVWELIGERRGDFQRETGLADPTGAGQGHQRRTLVTQELAERIDFRFPANEVRDVSWQRERPGAEAGS